MPNQKWVTDVTEFKYGNGKKAYLSAIKDLQDKSIVAVALITDPWNSFGERSNVRSITCIPTGPLKNSKKTLMSTYNFTITNGYRQN